MFDTIVQGLAWAGLIFFGGNLAAFIVFVGRSIWNDSIRPCLIPQAEIDRVAAEIIANYADPEEEAFARRERAWHRSEGAEQVYWLRVRKAVRKQLERR